MMKIKCYLTKFENTSRLYLDEWKMTSLRKPVAWFSRVLRGCAHSDTELVK